MNARILIIAISFAVIATTGAVRPRPITTGKLPSSTRTQQWTESAVYAAAEMAKERDSNGDISRAIDEQCDYDRIAEAPIDRPTSLIPGVDDPEPGVVYDHIYVGAHIDDAVWSVGGQAIGNVMSGQKGLLITVFTGVGFKTKWWDFALSKATLNYTQRLIEDENAATIIHQAAANGGRFDHLHLHFPDLPYRSLSENILGALALAGVYIPYVNTKLRSAIATKLASSLTTLATPDCQLYFPIGIGRHPDHIQAFLAGYTTATEKPYRAVTFYQDIPYMLNAKEIKWRMDSHSKEMYWFRRVHSASPTTIEEEWDTKIKAMQQYVTQLPMYWDPNNFEAEFLAQTNKTEFLWTPNTV